MSRTGAFWQRALTCFLDAVEAVMPAGKELHTVLDSYTVRKQPKVEA